MKVESYQYSLFMMSRKRQTKYYSNYKIASTCKQERVPERAPRPLRHISPAARGRPCGLSKTFSLRPFYYRAGWTSGIDGRECKFTARNRTRGGEHRIVLFLVVPQYESFLLEPRGQQKYDLKSLGLQFKVRNIVTERSILEVRGRLNLRELKTAVACQ